MPLKPAVPRFMPIPIPRRSKPVKRDPITTLEGARRIVLFVHRWMGAVFSLVFLTWFVSGMVLMYCPFPHVTDSDQWAHAVPIDPSQVRITPDQALQRIGVTGIPSQIRINVLDGRPAYRIAYGTHSRLVFADDGECLAGVTQVMALRAGAHWTGLPGDIISFARLLTEADQWTANLSHDSFPVWKFGWPDGDEVYVAQTTGEVIQYTTRRSRFGAYFGAIPHWFYFAALRRHVEGWTRTIISLAALGMTTAVLGLAGGIWVYSVFRRVPYLGIKRWHVVLGLVFGTVTTTWVFSGLLSMGAISWLDDPAGHDWGAAPRGVNVTRFAAKSPQQALIAAGRDLRVKELEFSSFDGEAIYLATESASKSRIVPMDADPQAGFDVHRIAAAVARSASPARLLEARTVTRYEPYYVDRNKSLPLPVVCVRLDDAIHSLTYINVRTGRVVQRYGTRGRAQRWLYHGLHSIDLPWLYAHRPLWDALVLGLLLGGSSLSMTSLPLAWRLVRRTLRAARVFQRQINA